MGISKITKKGIGMIEFLLKLGDDALLPERDNYACIQAQPDISLNYEINLIIMFHSRIPHY